MNLYSPTIVFFLFTIFSLLPSFTVAEHGPTTDLEIEEGQNRLKRLAKLLVDKFVRPADEGKKWKLGTVEKQLKALKYERDINLLRLVAEYSGYNKYNANSREKAENSENVGQFVINLIAVMLDTGVSGLSEKLKFSDFVPLLEKLRPFRALLEERKAKSTNKTFKKEDLDKIPQVKVHGESNWELPFMPPAVLRNLHTNQPYGADSFASTIKRMGKIVDFLLKFSKDIYEHPENLGDFMESKKTDEELYEEYEDTGLFELYHIFAKQSELDQHYGDPVKAKDKVDKLMQNFYLMIWNMYTHSKQRLQPYGLIYNQLKEVEDFYKREMGLGVSGPNGWDERLKVATEEMRKKFSMAVIKKIKDPDARMKAKYWGLVYANDAFIATELKKVNQHVPIVHPGVEYR